MKREREDRGRVAGLCSASSPSHSHLLRPTPTLTPSPRRWLLWVASLRPPQGGARELPLVSWSQRKPGEGGDQGDRPHPATFPPSTSPTLPPSVSSSRPGLPEAEDPGRALPLPQGPAQCQRLEDSSVKPLTPVLWEVPSFFPVLWKRKPRPREGEDVHSGHV